jgi:single-strand DNA-binding protein
MINKAILMGRLTRDPELRHTPSNIPVTTITLAVDRNVKRTGDPAQQTVDFIDVVAWNQTADFVTKYFRKGQLVAVVGRIQTRKWTDNEGKTRVAFEVVADEVHFAEGKRDNYGTGAAPQQGYGEGRPQGYRPPVSQPANDIPSPDQGFDEIVGDTDELPF